MSNGLCGGAAALVTIQRALKGKKGADAFLRLGKQRRKNLNTYIFTAFLYYKYSSYSIFLLEVQASDVKKTLDSGGFNVRKSS